MPTPSKVYRRRFGRLKSPSRSSNSKSRERRHRSVSPSRSRWRDDIRKMKSWREAKKRISKEKKCHKSLGSSISKTKSRVQLKKKIRKRTIPKTDEFILPNIHGSGTKTQAIEEEGILQLIPPEEPYQPANIKEVNIWYLPSVFQWSKFSFLDLGRLFKRTIDKKNL